MITFHNADAIAWANEYDGPLFHALLSDPPYHLTTITKRFGKEGSAPAQYGKDGAFARASRGFMNQDWDGGDIAFQPETWYAFGKVLYPGAFGMAFAGSRGWHRMAVAIEDAGFIIHPTIFLWCYSSGFPKATRIKDAPEFNGHRYGLQALKPAVEPVIVFQKPYEGRPLDNITQTGAGTLNIDAGRILLQSGDRYTINTFDDGAKVFGGGAGHEYTGREEDKGRWPANFILGDPEATAALDAQTGKLTSGEPIGIRPPQDSSVYMKFNQEIPLTGYGDSGGASRFFYNVQTALDESDPVYYCPKASRDEREQGLEDLDIQIKAGSNGARGAVGRGEDEYQGTGQLGLNRLQKVRNPHPTVKPLDLDRYLASLLLPPGEYAPRRLFNPFSGVGSESIGAHLAGWDEIVGVEKDTKNGYIDIARKRADHWTAKPVALDLFTGKAVVRK